MNRRIITTLVAWICGIAAIHAGGGVTVTGGEGNVGGKVDISVGLTTDAADVTAVEIHIPLPEGINPVEGSCMKVASRLPDHSVSADMKGRDYVIVIFNTSLKPIPAGTGKALGFSLDLGENPGVFDLFPAVKMSNASGDAVPCTSTGGVLTVKGARLELGTTDIDFGRVPIKGVYTREVSAMNTGTTELKISGITTDVPGLKVASAAASVAAGESTMLTLTYSPVERSSGIAGRFTVESNSVGRAPFVRVTSIPFSVNELHTGSAEGISDSEVTVALSMDNMEPIAGVDAVYALPEGLDYVEGSVSVSSRASGLKAEAYCGGDHKLRLLLYDVGNAVISAGSGEILSFRLRLAGRSGYYSLDPEKVVLGNRDGENMVSEVSGGTVVISSPSLQSDSELQIGNVPLSGTDTFDYRINNTGNVPLKIEKVVFLNDIARCDAKFPVEIQPNGAGVIPVTIVNPVFGEFTTVMNIYSNDPDNRMKSVEVSGNFYSPNEMSFTADYVDESFVMEASLANEAAITALQLDIVCPQDVTTSESLLTLSSRATDHSFTLAQIEANRYRLIIFSLKNTPFTGNDGLLFTLGFEGNLSAESRIQLEDIRLSSSDGKNYTTPGSEIKLSVSGVDSVSVDPDAKMNIYTINGMLVRKNACYSELKNLPPGIYIVNGKKTLIR